MDRFDIEFLDTAATRALAAAQVDLLPQREAIEKQATETANAMNKADLHEALTRLGHEQSAALTKAELVERYVKAVVSDSPVAEQLSVLGEQAYRDRSLARRLNGLLDASNKADEDLREIALTSSGHAMFSSLVWKVGKIMAAQATGRWATLVLAAVNNGVDLREAALTYLDEAFQAVRRAAKRALFNGIAADASDENAFEAVAANAYIDVVMQALRPRTVSGEGLMY